MPQTKAIVIDNGSSTCKAGPSNFSKPRIVFENAVGWPSRQGLGLERDGYVGSDLQSRRGLLAIEHPVKRGIIQNWDDMLLIWRHILENEMQADIRNLPIVVTEAVACPKAHREKLVEILFEDFGASDVFTGIPGAFTTFANPLNSSLIVDVGHGSIHVVPMFEGYILKDAIVSSQTSSIASDNDVAGCDVNKILAELLASRGYALASQLDTVQEIKEKLCFVTEDFEAETEDAPRNKDLKARFKTAGGQLNLKLDVERFQAPELMFDPARFDFNRTKSIQQLILESLERCPIDTKRSLCQNVVLAGQAWKFPGFLQRLRKELEIGSHGLSFRVTESFNSQHAAWFGAAALANMPFFKDLALTKRQYKEQGSTLIHRKTGFF